MPIRIRTRIQESKINADPDPDPKHSVQQVAAFVYIIQQWVWGVVQLNDRKMARYSILILVLWEIWERCEMSEREKRLNEESEW